MKVLILAGGLGTRLSEETASRPKPMVEIGGMPIIWHIMKIYSHYGFNDFIILGGYKVDFIKYYFNNYYLSHSDITIDLEKNDLTVHNNYSEPWKITIINTGLNTSTGSRIKMAKKYILESDEPFMLTYGDGVADIDINQLLNFHRSYNKIATLTAVRPSGRYGILSIDSTTNMVNSFVEKPKGDGNYINGGFFVFEKEFLNFIPDHDVMLEQEPLLNLVKNNQLNAFKHDGFWKAMDTLKDKNELNDLIEKDLAPWILW